MAKRFSELRAKMSPERRRRNQQQTDRMLLKLTPEPGRTKQCSGCNEVKALTEFYKSGRKEGVKTRCMRCMLAAATRYRATSKGKAATKRYEASPQGKAVKGAARARYNASSKGQATVKRYEASPEGKAVHRAGAKRYKASPKGKAYAKRYAASPKGKAVYRAGSKLYRATPKGQAAAKQYKARMSALSPFQRRVLRSVRDSRWRGEVSLCREHGGTRVHPLRPLAALCKLVQLELIECFGTDDRPRYRAVPRKLRTSE